MTKGKLLAGGAALTALALGTTVLVDSGSDNSDQRLVGIFADASPLEPGQDVRLQGVRIGTVKDITLEDGKAHVSMGVDLDSLPLHEDARMTLKPVNLLGEFYVDISPGTDSTPMLTSGVIPASQTSSIVTIQEVLDTLDDPTSTALAAVITGLGEGLGDAGAETSAALKALGPAMQDASKLGQVLSDQNQVLSALLARTEPVVGALAQRNGQVLDQVVQSTERMLAAVAAEQAAADATLAELPATLVAARRTLSRLAGASGAAVPTLQSLRPVTDNLEELTSELYAFADAADPALASLQPVLERANELMDRAAPVVAQLRAAGPDLAISASELQPLGGELLDRHLQDLMDFVRKWSLSTNGKDALSHYFRGVFHVTPNTLMDLAKSILPEGSVKQSTEDPQTLLPGLDVPGLLGDLGLGGVTAGLSQTLDGLGLGGLLGKPASPDSKSATGLSATQEQSLISQLLGGN